MAFTVSAAFDHFYENINLSGDHRETANSRRDHVVSLLKKNLEVVEAFASGSIPRFTAVREYADVDVIVALHYSRHIKDKSPAQVLQVVRDCLAEYKTGVRRNGQAVTLFYNSWPNVDIVPCARSVDNAGNVTHYEIPDMNRGVWIKSKPKLHSKHVEDRSATCGPSFRKIIKMIKWWNHKHSEFLQSFHLEVIALRVLTSSLTDIPWDVFTYFNGAATLIQSSLWHEGDSVDGYLGWPDRDEARKRLETARDLARDAWHLTYGSNNDHKTAITKWHQIFGDKFPEYG
jgi:hypothetical protein